MKSISPHTPLIHIMLILLLGFIAYSNTFHVPFQFDDEPVIVENPIVRNLHYFVEPSKAQQFTGLFEYPSFKKRYIGYLTFALNYKLHGLSLTGYHIVNLFIHICNSLLLYLLVILTFRTPALSTSHLQDHAYSVAAFTALLFVCHPMQTQAVTYIWQRVTSLASLFSVLSLVAYVQWRHSTSLMSSSTVAPRGSAGMKALPWYGLSLLSSVLAMKTKETAFMLPVTITLYEFLFFKKGGIKRRMFCLFPLLLTMLIIPLTLLDIGWPPGEFFDHVGEEIRGSTSLSRWHYLLAEFRVMVTYIRLIFLPVNQNLDYDYPRYFSLFETPVLMSLLFLVSLAGIGVFVLYRYRHTASHSRLISFGIFWFFIHLSLESSIIPLNNVIFEHRMYLPSAGIFLLISSGAFMAARAMKDRWKGAERTVFRALAVIVAVLTVLTFMRNSVWMDEVTLWLDVVSKSPNKPRGHNNLGNAYRKKNMLVKAEQHFMTALKIEPDHYLALNNLGHVLYLKGNIDGAITYYQRAIALKPGNAKVHNNLGKAYGARGELDKAIEHLQRAIEMKPAYPEPHYNLGLSYLKKGFFGLAVKQFLHALQLNPDYTEAHNNLGIIYLQNDAYDTAVKYFTNALKIRPAYPEGHHNLGLTLFLNGDIDGAIVHLRKAIELDPEYARAHMNLGNAYLKKNVKHLAKKHFQVGERLQKEKRLHTESAEQAGTFSDGFDPAE